MNPGQGASVADDIDLRLLRYFLVLAEELHFTRAAQRLFVSQPALSNQVRRLERYAGSRLFDRTTRGVELTPAGQAFHPYAERAVAALRAGIAAMGEDAAIRVDVLDAELATPRAVLSRLRRAQPQARVVVGAEGSVSQRRRILAGDLDAGFCGLGAVNPDLAYEVVRREPVDLILPAGHRLARRRRIPFGDLAGETFYLPNEGLAPEWNAFVVDACHRAGFDPVRYAVSTATATAALDLVAEGVCVTLSLRSTPHPAGTARRRLEPELTGDRAYAWVLVWHPDRADAEPVRLLRQAVADARHDESWE
ncbi:MAG: LysR family transcriptional regulator [Hamadaea sp.]|uniref:LysR family transcriptional regulator n=1 Tax=Hamadaea sp. TaxID=2024425 RepID=UPI00180DFF72|nr:LysR substrate-binding domain-containing protein [Hamadaea sp.]NUR71006.1 LysR family transcriptional regulator [Hamadaea sp.]NUT23687.1 LysR family transcriptional regulator [Hamadaea sp.]